MQPILGVYWAPGHSRPTDLAYMQALQPPMVRVLDPDVQQVSDAYRVTRARIAPRFWYLDDRNYEAHAALLADPIGFGHRNAAEQVEVVRAMEKQAKERGIHFPPPGETYLNAVNEFPIWGGDQNERRSALNAYSMVFGADVEAAGYCALLGCINVGHPADDTWDWYAGALAWLEQSKRSALELHEYWQPEGPSYTWVDERGNNRSDATWLAWRHKRLRRNVRVVIGECGVDGVLHGRHADRNTGWRAYMDGATYAEQLVAYTQGCDQRVVACLPFLTDYRENTSNNWASFDTAPAHGDILARKDRMKPVPDVFLPVVEGPKAGAKIVHPCPSYAISQHFYQNPEDYARFGMPGHNGTDFAVPQGSAVVSPVDGVVEMVGQDIDYGNYVRIYSQAFGAHFFMAHALEVTTRIGQVVKVGERVMTCGSTGNSTGPHVHLEVRLGEGTGYAVGTPMPKGRVDPETWFAMHGLKL